MGFKQAEHVCYLELSNILKQEGFAPLQSDASLFLWRKGDVWIIMPIFTDE